MAKSLSSTSPSSSSVPVSSTSSSLLVKYSDIVDTRAYDDDFMHSRGLLYTPWILWSVWLVALFTIPHVWHAALDAVDAALGTRVTDWQVWVIGTCLLGSWQFISSCIVTHLIEFYWRPASLMQYKIQPTRGPARPLIRHAMAVAVFNHFVIGPIAWVLMVMAQRQQGGVLDVRAPIPPASHVLLSLIVFAACEDFFFYHAHALIHYSPFLYRHIHKMHHKFSASVAWAAVYAHPIEHLFANLFPLVAGPLILRSHVFVFWWWISLGLQSTTHSHSGFQFPGFGNSIDHDLHHQKQHCHYGIGFFDWLYGTQYSDLLKQQALEKEQRQQLKKTK